MKTNHTPGPWRWELNVKTRYVHLCGGRPMFDKEVMSFRRWGMNSATPEFRVPIPGQDECAHMVPAHQLGVPVKGREHHKHWFQDISDPDAKLIASAPDLLEALYKAKAMMECDKVGGYTRTHDGKDFAEKGSTYETVVAAIKKATE